MFRISWGITKRCFSTIPHFHEVGYSLLSHKGLISIKGPDSSKFLNGLVTAKLIPNSTKKKVMTISTDEDDISTHLDKFDETETNWGLLRESSETKNQTISRNGIYSMILNSKGRIVTDTFIYPFNYVIFPKDNDSSFPQYLLEVDRTIMKSILSLLKIHKLKAKVDIKEVDTLKVWYAFNDSKQEELYKLQSRYFDEESTVLKSPVESLNQTERFLRDPSLWNTQELNSDDVIGFAFDDRCPDFGIRIITPSHVTDLSKIINTSYLPRDSPLLTKESIDLRRHIFGIPETPTELKPNKFLPLEANLEYMGGVSFDKGCYVGQELTVRTFHTGIVRKRIVPVKLYPYHEDPSSISLTQNNDICESIVLNNSEIFADDQTKEQSNDNVPYTPSPFGASTKSTSPRRSSKRSSGTILSNVGSNGLALIRLEDFANEDARFSVEIPRGGEDNKTLKVGVKAFIPYWWPTD